MERVLRVAIRNTDKLYPFRFWQIAAAAHCPFVLRVYYNQIAKVN